MFNLNETITSNSQVNSDDISQKYWEDMKKANTINADKYFHCKANFEATKKSHIGKTQGATLNYVREAYGLIKGDGIKDIKEDMQANYYGQEKAKSNEYETAEEACALFRPSTLDKKY